MPTKTHPLPSGGVHTVTVPNKPSLEARLRSMPNWLTMLLTLLAFVAVGAAFAYYF